MPRVSRSRGPVFAMAAPAYPTDVSTLNASTPFLERRALTPQVGPPRQQPFAAGMLNPEAGGRDRELALGRQAAAMGDGEERDPMEVDLFEPGIGVELDVEQKMAGFMRAERDCRPAHELPDRAGAARSRRPWHPVPTPEGRPKQRQQHERGDLRTSCGTRVAG